MASSDRRDFLKQTAAGITTASALGATGAAAAEPTAELDRARVSPHRSLVLSGLHAYAEKTLRAGQVVHFRVSSAVPYRLAIYRLGPDIDNRASDELVHRFPDAPAATQPIHPGSYVHIANGLAANEPLTALTLECWVRPWRLDRMQGVLTQLNFPQSPGYGLLLDKKARVHFYLGDTPPDDRSSVQTGPALKEQRWHHIVGVWDGQRKTLWVDGVPGDEQAFTGPIVPGAAPLRLGASGIDGLADGFLDGDLAMPVIYGAALSAAEIAARFKDQALHTPAGPTVLACWPLAEERGARVADSGAGRRDGRIVNHGAWMIGGPSFDAAAVPHFAAYQPTDDPRRGHGLRLASDDMVDCGWNVSHSVRIPADARQGIYTGRFEFELRGKPFVYDVTFVVTRPAERPKADALVLCSTSTWLAYSATPFAENRPPRSYWAPNGAVNSPGDPPAYCCYRDHRAGQPAYYFGLNVPWPAAGPDVLYSPPEVGYSHLMRGERFVHEWLDRTRYRYDVATDLDLHRDPELLRGYKVLIVNGHSEYWSSPAYDAADRFLRDGGNMLVLSGNTMFWRVSFDDDLAVMECRKFGRNIGGSKHAQIGELWHSQDGRRGSLMRQCGIPAWKVVGLECLGWWGTGAKDFGSYEAREPDHFLFNRPQKVKLRPGEAFGQAAAGIPAAIGHETDVRVSTLIKRTLEPIPSGGALPQEPQGIVTLAHGLRQKQWTSALDYFARPLTSPDRFAAEMIYWERPNGGRVFNAGAIGAGWALASDPKLQTLVSNVLHHFGVRPREA